MLVNNVTSLPQRGELPSGMRSFWHMHPFWEMPIWVWDAFHQVGLRSHYVASVFAAPLLIEGGRGLIVFISAPGSKRYVHNVPYRVGKAGVEKLAAGGRRATSWSQPMTTQEEAPSDEHD